MKPINEQISSEIAQQARKLTQYTRILHKVLPIECRNHVQVANIRQQNLILITDSPVWTTRLRQLSPTILQYLRDNSASYLSSESDKPIHHIQITTRYSHNENHQQKTTENPQPNKPKISEKSAKLLSQSANSIGNEQLKSALLRVASHSKKDK